MKLCFVNGVFRFFLSFRLLTISMLLTANYNGKFPTVITELTAQNFCLRSIAELTAIFFLFRHLKTSKHVKKFF